MKNFMIEREEIRQEQDQLKYKLDRLIRACGWDYSSDWPDSCWRWSKTITWHGKPVQMICPSAEDAADIESRFRPEAEQEEFEKWGEE